MKNNSMKNKCALTPGSRAYLDRKVTEYDKSTEMKLEIEGTNKMKQFNLNLRVGDKVKVIGQDYDSKKLSLRKVIAGKVIFKSDNYITIKGKNYCESFRITDFYIGTAKLVGKDGQALCN